MQKIILYYKFAPLKDPDAIKLWQKSLCEKLNLKGRIIISSQGINGTLGGDIDDLKKYVTEMKLLASFKDTKYKWSDGERDDFPRLSIRVRDEIVTFNATDELKVNEKGISNGGKHLSPQQVHELVDKKKGDVIFFDGRNKYESEVGRFKNAVTPDVRTAKDFARELEKPEYEDLKDKPVVTYCTGGIRCEILTVLMKNRGFKEVYQIDGGIVNYTKKYKDDGLWEGSLYVFDKRMGVKSSETAVDIGNCVVCGNTTSNYINCANVACNEQILVCENCNLQKLCPICDKNAEIKAKFQEAI